MATPINDLPAASALTGAEEIAANQSGNTVKITTQELVDLAGIGTSGLTTQILVGGGAGVDPVWTTATGSGAPVRATSPTLTTPTLGVATATSLSLSTDLAITDGGTGQSTAEDAFNALSPLTTAGDLLVYTTTNTRLPKGNALQALRMNGAGTAVEWSSAVGDALTTNPLSQFATTSSAQLRGVMSDETGTGSLVFNTSPTLVTPTLGVATATSITLTNPLAIADGGTGNISARDAFDALAPSTTKGDLIVRNNSHNVRFPVGAALTVLRTNATADDIEWTTLPGGGDALTSDPLSQFAATTSAQLAGVITDETGSGSLVFANGPSFVTPILGTPDSGNLVNCTGYTFANISGVSANVATWAVTPSSANLAAAVTDETGSGALVFADTPTLVTPVLGVATATTINKVTIDAPATGATLIIDDGKTFRTNNTITLAGTDGTTMTFPSVSATIPGLAVANSFTTAQLIQPGTDVAPLTLRRQAALATSNLLQIQDESNNPLVTVDKDGNVTATSFSGSLSGNAATVTVGDAGGDTTTWVLLGTGQTGSLSPATDAGLTYNATTNALTATTFVGALTGNADTVTVADAGGDTTTWVLLGTSQTGSLAPATDAGLTYNATSNALTATTFVGALTGTASGNATVSDVLAYSIALG